MFNGKKSKKFLNMVKHVMLCVITDSNFHELRFPEIFFLFLLSDHVKEKQRIIDAYNTLRKVTKLCTVK